MTPTPEIDGTWSTYSGRAAESWQEIYESDEYVTRWHATSPYERWWRPIPFDIINWPPEDAGYHGLRESRGSFDPARFLGTHYSTNYVNNAAEDEDDPFALSHRMYTAVGRLFGCLHVDNHPGAPQMTLHDKAGYQEYAFATVDDVRKYGRLVQAAAKEVLEHEWVPPESVDQDELLPRDQRVLELGRFLETAPEDFVYDNGWVIHPSVVADFEKERAEYATYREALRLRHQPPPLNTFPFPNLAAADWTPPRDQSQDLTQPHHLLNDGRLRYLEKLPDVLDVFDYAFTHAATIRSTTPWPTVTRTHTVGSQGQDIETMTFTRPTDNLVRNRLLLNLLRDAAHHVHLTTLRVYRAEHAWPDVDARALADLIRTLDSLDSWDDDAVRDAISDAVARSRGPLSGEHLTTRPE